MTIKQIVSMLKLEAESLKEHYKEELWESEDIEEFANNEFFGGKLEATQDIIELLEKYQ